MNRWVRLAIGAVLALAIWRLAWHIPRHDTFPLLLTWAIAIGGFLMYWKLSATQQDVWTGFGLGLALRLLLVFSMPSLSDDYHRFVWDGRLIAAGEDPFSLTPTGWVQQNDSLPDGLSLAHYQQLNSPDYFTVYPPVAQGVYYLSAALSTDTPAAVRWMKLVLLLAEIGTLGLLILLLRHFGLPRKQVLLYALNPLVLLEGVGNLHFEILMIFFLLLSLYWLAQARPMWATAPLALAIGTKLLPLMLMPIIWRYLGLRRGLYFCLLTGFWIGLLLLPWWHSSILQGMGSSLQLYFQTFEFNAGPYFLIRAIGFYLTGYNIIHWAGPMLSLLALGFILVISLRTHTQEAKWLATRWAWIFFVYLLAVTTLHPWYILPLVALSVIGTYRMAIVWSMLVFFTYAGYSNTGFQENYGVVWIEFLAVAVAAYGDWKAQKADIKSTLHPNIKA